MFIFVAVIDVAVTSDTKLILLRQEYDFHFLLARHVLTMALRDVYLISMRSLFFFSMLLTLVLVFLSTYLFKVIIYFYNLVEVFHFRFRCH